MHNNNLKTMLLVGILVYSLSMSVASDIKTVYADSTISISNGFMASFNDERRDDERQDAEITRKQLRVNPSPVICTFIYNAPLHSSINGRIIDRLKAGQEVEIIQDRSYLWYQVSFDDKIGWIKAEYIKIPDDPETNLTRLSKDYLENFINVREFKSSTPYFLWVDIDRQLVYIFKGSEGQWSLHKTMVCSTGKNESPTVRGTFEISDRGKWFYTDRLKSGAKNWVRFHGAYLFHSLPFAKDRKNITDYTLGKRASSGCIRLSLKDSDWIYDNIKKGTAVWVY